MRFGRPWRSWATVLALETALILSCSGGFVGVRFAIDYAPIFLILLGGALFFSA